MKGSDFKTPISPGLFFYLSPIGIRYEIGGNEEIYLPNEEEDVNPIYTKNALCRAKTLFQSLPYPPTILRIDSSRYIGVPQEDSFAPQEIGLPLPDEAVTEEMTDEDGDRFLQNHLYWDLTQTGIDVEKLLLDIIEGDLVGYLYLSSCVYFANDKHPLLYHLYDHRGADIVAAEKELLLPLYQDHKDWILAYDQKRIDALFLEKSDL